MADRVLSSRLEVVSVKDRPARKGEVPGSTVYKSLSPRRELVATPTPAPIVQRKRDTQAIASASRAAFALRMATDPVYQFVKRQEGIVRDAQARQKSAATELLARQFGAARAAEMMKPDKALQLRARLAKRQFGAREIA